MIFSIKILRATRIINYGRWPGVSGWPVARQCQYVIGCLYMRRALFITSLLCMTLYVVGVTCVSEGK